MIKLEWIDWLIIGAYLLFALCIGFLISGKAKTSRRSFFIADGSLPWWLTGVSIAATTFAADTPLAVTGIVANRGLSGNWIWLSWMGVHALVVVFFARAWKRSNVITDAEYIELRYSGKWAARLRLFRSLLYGVLYNCIIMGWVLRAMGKIVEPYVDWQHWLPPVYNWVASFWPQGLAMGNASEGMTVIFLLMLVVLYSSLGGIRGVIITDLVQFGFAMLGSIWLAVTVWNAAGGGEEIALRLTELYGPHHEYLNLFPDKHGEWMGILGGSAFLFGFYILIQSFANVPADGGGYLMQRLNTTRDEKSAQKSAVLFLVLQYLVRIWPWLIVAVAALVLIPIGMEDSVLDGRAAKVAIDREAAYPVLIGVFLPNGVLGLMIVSMMSAFMSTIDTHLNWGSSYLVNDVAVKFFPKISIRRQILVARGSVIGFAVLAVWVCVNIETIEQAWKWVAFIGASLGLPTMLRWVWWRVTALSEILAASGGLLTAWIVNQFTSLPYEMCLIYCFFGSATGFVLGIFSPEKLRPEALQGYMKKAKPLGFWPGKSKFESVKDLTKIGAAAVLIVGVSILLLKLGLIMFFGRVN
jgi:solute:Na+ symporter, SSS family